MANGWLESIALGVLQGATEFLPISSSGHLRLAEHLFGQGEPDLLFDVVLHVGTLLAVIVVYRKDLWTILQGAWRGVSGLRRGGLAGALEPPGVRLTLLLIVATVPTGIIGVLLKDLVDGPFFDVPVVGGLLLLNGVILLASRLSPHGKLKTPVPEEVDPDPDAPGEPERPGGIAGLSLWKIGLLAAVIIGVAQGLAVLPGISRSGLTITTALFLSVQREEAARFSFLLSIPAILGALVLKLGDAAEATMSGARLAEHLAGALAAFGVGWLCLILLMRMLRRAQFHHFAWYCFAVGAASIAWAAFGP